MKDISKAYTDKVLLDHVDFGIDTGARIGIIGINGTGKSTLLRLIAGKEEPGKLKARIKSLKASGAKVKKEINDLSLRIKKSFAKLKLCENK